MNLWALAALLSAIALGFMGSYLFILLARLEKSEWENELSQRSKKSLAPGGCDVAHKLRKCPESPDLRFDFVVPII